MRRTDQPLAVSSGQPYYLKLFDPCGDKIRGVCASGCKLLLKVLRAALTTGSRVQSQHHATGHIPKTEHRQTSYSMFHCHVFSSREGRTVILKIRSTAIPVRDLQPDKNSARSLGQSGWPSPRALSVAFAPWVLPTVKTLSMCGSPFRCRACHLKRSTQKNHRG